MSVSRCSVTVFLVSTAALLTLTPHGVSCASTRPILSIPPFIRRGQCSLAASPIVNFDREQFSGRWFKIGGMRNPDEEKSTKCTTLDYFATVTGVSVLTSGVNSENKPHNEITEMNMNPATVGQFQFSARGRDVALDVIATDYKNYACMISCVNIIETHYALFAWILNRKPNMSRDVIAACQLAMKKTGIPVGDLRGTVQGPRVCSYPPLQQ